MSHEKLTSVLIMNLNTLKKKKNEQLEASHVALVVKKAPANAGDVREMGSIPGSGRPPGGGRGNPLQYSCLENPIDRGAWWAIVHRVPEKSDTTEVA